MPGVYRRSAYYVVFGFVMELALIQKRVICIKTYDVRYVCQSKAKQMVLEWGISL